MKSSIRSNKTELLATIQINYQKLIGDLKSIQEDQTRFPTLEGNISICDIIAYQIGWGTLLMG